MKWFKQHQDSIIVIGSIMAALWIAHGELQSINVAVLNMENRINERFAQIEKELAVMKAVLTMQKLIPDHLVHKIEELNFSQGPSEKSE